MIRLFMVLTALLLVLNTTQAQLDAVEIAKEKGRELKGKGARKAREKALALLEKQKEEFDASNFNYAISFLDNSGSFEAREKGSAFSSALLNARKFLEHEEKTRRERAYSAMRSGELLLAGNKFMLSEKNLKLAITLYEEEGDKQSSDYAQAVGDLGLLYLVWGRFAKAAPLVDKALSLHEAGNNKSMVTVGLNNVSVLKKEK